MGFSAEARKANMDIWREILTHPFIVEMGEGTLPIEKFKHYIAQDALFLEDLLSALLIAGSKSDAELKRFFIKLADETIKGEVEMQSELGNLLGDIKSGYTPTTLAYTSYIVKVAYIGAPEELLAALAPCFWSYADIGLRLAGSPGTKHRVYGLWIGVYASQEYQNLVKKYLDVLDRRADKAGETIRKKMHKWFSVSTKYEKMFWDMAYFMESGW